MKRTYYIDGNVPITVEPATDMCEDTFEKLLPTYGTLDSACFDFKMPVLVNVRKYGYNFYLIRTLLKFTFPPQYTLFILSRSSLAMKGCVVVNSPGVIDSDYRGEIKVLLRIPKLIYNEVRKQGTCFAQGMFTRVYNVNFKIKNSHARGEGGFGSTD